jgi:Carboxypeptidase regulatory-like domain
MTRTATSRFSFLFIVVLVTSISISAQTVSDDRSIEAPTSGMITGRVVTESGQPIADATVYIRALGPSLLPPRRVPIDSDGTFRATGLDPALYFITATAPTYVPTARETESRTPSYYRLGDSVTLTFVKGGVITGAVTTGTGEPVIAIPVRALLIRDAKGQPVRGMGPQFGERLTDDRGIYRLYGLAAGTYLISAGSRNVMSADLNAYDLDAPVFAPSSTRETAAEVTVHAGEEITGVDIRYKREPGHIVSGTVSRNAAGMSGMSVIMRRIVGGAAELSSNTFLFPGSSGFAFYGIADGEYELEAQFALGPNQAFVSEPQRIVVKGSDVSGIVLVPIALGTVAGRVVLESSTAPECKGKRQPSFEETLVTLAKLRDAAAKDQSRMMFTNSQAIVEKSGEFLLRSLRPGRYVPGATFFARYWYLKKVALNVTVGGKPTANDVARDGITLKSGDQLTNLTVILAEGASSLRGSISVKEGEKVPPGSVVFLVPAERGDDPLRFFAAAVDSDGKFAFANVAPGSYWPIIRTISPEDRFNVRSLRDPDQIDRRMVLRREAEARKESIELKPCQNVTEYVLNSSKH